VGVSRSYTRRLDTARHCRASPGTATVCRQRDPALATLLRHSTYTEGKIMTSVTDAAFQPVVSLAPVAPSTTLMGFDLVWAVTQNTVNSQLAWLQESGCIPRQLQIGSMDLDGIAIGSDTKPANIAPPTVDFDTGVAQQARLSITFTSGNVQHYKGFGRNAEIVTTPITGWKLAFKVNLNLGQIAHDHLTTDSKIPPEILQKLEQFSSSDFSIQSIFLDFQNSDMVNYDTVTSVINTDDEFLKQNFATSLGAWIGGHHGQDNPFILGYPVTRVTESADLNAVFQPTGTNLSTHAYEQAAGTHDPALAGLSTLNFLLVTGERKIKDTPALYAPDAGSFHRNLVPNNDIDGRGIIAREIFFARYLDALLIQPFEKSVNSLPDYVNARADRQAGAVINDKSAAANGRAHFVRTKTGWTYQDHVKLGWHESGFNSHDRASEQDLQFTVDVSMQPDAGGASRLTMDVSGSLMRYENDQVNQDMPFKNNVYIGKGWARATLTWSIRLQFVAGLDGKITITHTSQTADPVKESGTEGGYKVADFFSGLLGYDGIAGDWRKNAGSLAVIDKDVIDKLIQEAVPTLDAAAATIVMPAASQFFYKNMQLNADGDIEIDFTYKSSTQ
jgi:hypothetical protein